MLARRNFEKLLHIPNAWFSGASARHAKTSTLSLQNQTPATDTTIPDVDVGIDLNHRPLGGGGLPDRIIAYTLTTKGPIVCIINPDILNDHGDIQGSLVQFYLSGNRISTAGAEATLGKHHLR